MTRAWQRYREQVADILAKNRGRTTFYAASGKYVVHVQEPLHDAPDVELVVRRQECAETDAKQPRCGTRSSSRALVKLRTAPS